MKQCKSSCDLQSCLLCRLCLKEWVPLIDVNRSSFQAKKGELIFREGEEVKGIYFVYSGSVKVHKKWGSEKELIVRFAKKGDIVGHRGLGKDNLYPISATALEPVTVCFIALDFFQASLKVNHEVLFQLMMFFAEELKESERKMRNLAHMPVKGRIAQALLTLREKFGLNTAGFIDIVLSRQDLASYSGTTYETVFRIMGELVQEGAISVAGKQIAIVDEERLVGFTKEGEG